MNALSPNEVAVIQMSLGGMIEDMEESSKNQNFNFTPEARKDLKEMLHTAKSALAKIVLASGKAVRLDPYKEGDEKDFLTKQS